MTRFLLLLAAGTTVAVLAASGTGCNGGGDGRRERLPAPTMLAATGGDGIITVSWAAVEGAERYLIYSAREPGVTPENVEELDGGDRDEREDTSYDDNVANGETRWYVVTAVANAREGDHSIETFGAATPWGPADVVEIASGDALSPRIAAEPGGRVHAVWARHREGRFAIHASTYENGGWSAPATVDSSAGFSRDPRIVAAAGQAIVVWAQGEGGGTADDVWANRLVVMGTSGTWAAPERLEADAGPARNPAVAMAPNGDAIAAWTQDNGTSDDIRASVFDAGTATWTAAGAIDVETADAAGAQVAMDAGGNGLGVWTQGGSVMAARFDGSAFLAPVAVTGTNAGATNVQLVLEPGGANAVAIWEQATSTGTDIAAARFTPGGGWTVPVLVESHPLGATQPRVALDADGRAVAVWRQDNGTYSAIGTARQVPPDTAWVSYRLFEADDSGNARDPEVAVDVNGEALAVFTQQVVELGGPGVTENVYAHRIGLQDTSASGPVFVASKFGGNWAPQLVIGSGGAATAVWLRYGAAGNEIWFNRLP